MKTNKKDSDEKTEKEKKTYIKPEIETEELLAFGAICNGTTTGQRKSTTGAPNFCASTRLSS